jgi:hypothetical protein
MNDPHTCKACGAPLALSLQALKKEGSEPNKCVFCSTPIGGKYRPFEEKILRRKRSRGTALLLLTTLLVVFAVFSAFSALTAWQTYSCLSMTTIERLISGCIQPGLYPVSSVSLRVREDSALPEQHRLLQAVLLSHVRRLQFKLGDQFLFDTDASTTPLHLSANGEWLLLRDGNQQLKIHPALEQQRSVINFDLQSCRLNAQASQMNFSWSPDGRRLMISAISDGVRRVKLATLDTETARLERCDDAYSQNVSAAAWLSDKYLLYLIEEGGRKRLEVRTADGAQLIFWSELQLVSGVLSDLQISPNGRYVLFTSDDLSGQKSLYWLDWSEKPLLYVSRSAEYRIDPSRLFGWANEHQIAYLNAEGQLVLLNLQAQTISFVAMPTSTVWMAWRGAN